MLLFWGAYVLGIVWDEIYFPIVQITGPTLPNAIFTAITGSSIGILLFAMGAPYLRSEAEGAAAKEFEDDRVASFKKREREGETRGQSENTTTP